jgi:hypothetical protein
MISPKHEPTLFAETLTDIIDASQCISSPYSETTTTTPECECTDVVIAKTSSPAIKSQDAPLSEAMKQQQQQQQKTTDTSKKQKVRSRRSLSWKPLEDDPNAKKTGMYGKRTVCIPMKDGIGAYTLCINNFVVFEGPDDDSSADASEERDGDHKPISTIGTSKMHGFIIDMYYDSISKARKVRIRVLATEADVADAPKQVGDRTELPRVFITDRVVVIKTTREIRSMRPLIVNAHGVAPQAGATVFFADGEYVHFVGNSHSTAPRYVYVGLCSPTYLAEKNFTTIPPSALLRHETATRFCNDDSANPMWIDGETTAKRKCAIPRIGLVPHQKKRKASTHSGVRCDETERDRPEVEDQQQQEDTPLDFAIRSFLTLLSHTKFAPMVCVE